MIWANKNENLALVERVYLGRDTSDLSCISRVFFLAPNTKLTNLSELQALFGLRQNSSIKEVLISAWHKWGSEMADKLRGAFGFAIFDVESQSVYMARDPFGLCPVYYSLDEIRLIVGSSSRLVRSTFGSHAKQDQLMLADFICGVVLERQNTFFEKIKRFSAGHYMLLRRNKLTTKQYWSVSDSPKDVHYGSPSRVFYDHFKRSVKNSFNPNSSTLMLSGGLDSSAIAGAIKDQDLISGNLPCMSLIYNETEDWSDGKYLRDISHFVEADIKTFKSDFHNPLDNMEHWLKVVDGPYLPYGHSVSFRLLPAAKELGFSHVLSGHGGDEVVSYGFGRLNELAKRGLWRLLWNEVSASSNLYGGSKYLIYYRYLAHIEILKKGQKYLRRKRRIKEHRSPIDSDSLSKNLKNEIDLSRYNIRVAAQKIEHDERMIHDETLAGPLQATALEVFALCSEASGVTTEMPFFDRELVEFCLSLPSDWKLRASQSRYILREALKGKVPESIRLRQSKFDFGGNFKMGLLSDIPKLLELTDPKASSIDEYVNTKWLESLRNRIISGDRDLYITEAFFLWRVAILNLWLGMISASLEKPELRQINLAHDELKPFVEQ